MPELEQLIREARPLWPEAPEREAQILEALGLPDRPVQPRRGVLGRLRRSRRGRVLLVGALLAGAGAALAVALVGRPGASSTGAPASLAFDERMVVGTSTAVVEDPPAVAVDPAGRVAVAWSRGGRVVVALGSGDDTGFSAPVRLSHPAHRASDPQLVATGPGRFVALWRARLPGRLVSERLELPGGRPAGVLSARVGTRWALMARATDAEGTWGPAEQVADSGSARDLDEPAMARAEGRPVAVFSRGGRIVAAERVDGAWRSRVLSAPAELATRARVSSDLTGRFAIAAWRTRSTDPVSGGARWQGWTAVRTPEGGWSAARPVGGTEPFPRSLSAAIGGDGRAIVAWTDARVSALLRAPEGEWTEPETAIEPPFADSMTLDPPVVAIDGQGRSLVGVAYFRRRESSPMATTIAPAVTLQARGPADGSFQAPTRLGAVTVGLTVVPDAGGGLVQTWIEPGPRSIFVRALGPDGAVRAGARLTGGGSWPVLAVGADGTSAVVTTDGGRVLASVAPGRGAP